MLLLACLCAGPACCCWQAAASSICVSVHALQPPNSTLCERGHSVDSTLCVNMRNLQPPHSHLAGKGRNPAGRGISLLLPNSETACMGSGMPATSQGGQLHHLLCWVMLLEGHHCSPPMWLPGMGLRPTQSVTVRYCEPAKARNKAPEQLDSCFLAALSSAIVINALEGENIKGVLFPVRSD